MIAQYKYIFKYDMLSIYINYFCYLNILCFINCHNRSLHVMYFNYIITMIVIVYLCIIKMRSIKYNRDYSFDQNPESMATTYNINFYTSLFIYILPLHNCPMIAHIFRSMKCFWLLCYLFFLLIVFCVLCN